MKFSILADNGTDCLLGDLTGNVVKYSGEEVEKLPNEMFKYSMPVVDLAEFFAKKPNLVFKLYGKGDLFAMAAYSAEDEMWYVATR